eukprot:753839-Hanusia_phi.AAC.2
MQKTVRSKCGCIAVAAAGDNGDDVGSCGVGVERIAHLTFVLDPSIAISKQPLNAFLTDVEQTPARGQDPTT